MRRAYELSKGSGERREERGERQLVRGMVHREKRHWAGSECSTL